MSNLSTMLNGSIRKRIYIKKGDFPWRIENGQYIALYDEKELLNISKILNLMPQYATELNSGLLGFTCSKLDIDLLNNFLGALYKLGYNDKTPRFDLMEQALFSFIVAMSGTHSGLSKQEYICTSRERGYDPSYVARHFLGKSKFSEDYLLALKIIYNV